MLVSVRDDLIPVNVNTSLVLQSMRVLYVNEGLTQAIKTCECVTKAEEKERVLEVQTSEASLPVD